MQRLRIKRTISRAAATLALMVLTTATTWAQTTESVKYIDANGIEQTVTATVLTGSESDLGAYNKETWYFVGTDISHTGEIDCYGNVNIILADGKTMTTNHSDSNGAIWGAEDSTIAIYGQTAGTGTLNINGNDCDGIKSNGNLVINGGNVNAILNVTHYDGDNAIVANGTVTINGGNVTADATGGNNGIYGRNGVTINGGTVNVTGGDLGSGINAKNGSGTITLGWTRATDRITANSYNGTVTVAPSQAFLTDDDPARRIIGTVSDLSTIAGKTLTPDLSTGFTVSSNGNTYTIWNATGWGLLCDALQDNDTYNRFSGKTVRLGADIEVTRMAGSQYHDFCGTFDGGGHTLTFNHGTSDSYASDEYTAPFCYVSNTKADPSDAADSPVTIRNLHVAGDIYTTAKYAAGLIARQWGTVNIENCRSSIVVHSNVTNDDNDGTHGGFVSVQQSGTLNFTGCLFDGKLLTTAANATTKCGGFVGYRSGSTGVTASVTNCLYAPAGLADGETEAVGNSATFVRNWSGTPTNSYYTRLLGTAQGKQARTITAGENVTVALSGTATEYATSGITSYGTGIKYDNVLYAGEGDNVNLTLGNTAPTGYGLSAYTASVGTLDGTTLTMPDADVEIGATFARLPVSVSYIDGSGAEQTANAQPLTEAGSHDGGWYVVDEDFDTDQPISFTGDVNLILCDGKTLTAKNSITINDGTGTLNTYGQTLGIGMLNASGADGANGSMMGTSGYDGYNGKSGANGINGNVIVNSGLLSVKGGNGGRAERHVSYKTYGGSGGNGIEGTFTLNGGTANISGGNGGMGRNPYGNTQRAAHGCGVTGTVTSNVATAIIQESDDNSTWSDLASGSTSTKQYIKAEVYIPGDANGDGQVTITDAVAIVNYILGNASADFNPRAANVNDDYDDEGKPNITITDAVGVVNIILNSAGSSAPQLDMTEPEPIVELE